jgi:CHASE1-domain containing sensor protein
MAEQWVPVVAAVLGLLGGMAGAAVGGYVANEGQEQRFEHERATQLRDLRTDTYVSSYGLPSASTPTRPRPTTA